MNRVFKMTITRVGNDLPVYSFHFHENDPMHSLEIGPEGELYFAGMRVDPPYQVTVTEANVTA
jgi:hypothetical protein